MKATPATTMEPTADGGTLRETLQRKCKRERRALLRVTKKVVHPANDSEAGLDDPMAEVTTVSEPSTSNAVCVDAAAVPTAAIHDSLKSENEMLRTLLKENQAEKNRLLAKLKCEVETMQKVLEEGDGDNSLNPKIEQSQVNGPESEDLAKAVEQLRVDNLKLKGIIEEKNVELASQILISGNLRSRLSQVDALTKCLAEKDADLQCLRGTNSGLRRRMRKMKQVIGRQNRTIAVLSSTLRSEKVKASSVTCGNPLGLPGMHPWIRQTSVSQKKGSVLSLFGDVLKILVRPPKNNPINWRNLMPILKQCRLVCKSWKESVDQFLQQDSSHLALCGRNTSLLRFKEDFTPCPLKLSSLNFDTSATTKLFRDMLTQPFRNPDYNPVPTRHVMIVCHYECEWRCWKYMQLVTRYLQVFGKQVWYLTVHVTGRNWNHVLDLGVISGWLSQVPNLRSVAMEAKEVIDHRGVEYLMAPHFPNLSTFQCTGNTVLFQRILEKNGQVQKLNFVSSSTTPPGIMKIEFQNLSELTCHLYNQECWQQLISNTWNPAKLSLAFYYDTPSIKTILEGLGHYENCLKSLTLDLSLVQMNAVEEEGVKLMLPELRELHIVLEGWNYSLEPILKDLEKLERVTLELSHSNPASGCNLEKLNVVRQASIFWEKTTATWMKLPKLKDVNLIVTLNNREVGRKEYMVSED